jgi:hypothetical protein
MRELRVWSEWRSNASWDIHGRFESVLSAWREARLWVTVLWTLVLATGAAGWDWAERRMAAGPSPRPVLLLPDRDPGDEQRREIARRLAGEPGIASAKWRSPSELSRAMTRRFDDDRWRALLPTDQSDWLPWMLEVRPAEPLDGLAQVEAFVVRRRQEGGWGVLWDGVPARRLLKARRELRIFLGLGLALVGLIGAAALRGLGWPTVGGRAFWGWSAGLGTVAPLAVAAGGWLAGAPVGARAALVAAAAGFLLAGLVAPMIRMPGPPEHADGLHELPPGDPLP